MVGLVGLGLQYYLYVDNTVSPDSGSQGGATRGSGPFKFSLVRLVKSFQTSRTLRILYHLTQVVRGEPHVLRYSLVRLHVYMYRIARSSF